MSVEKKSSLEKKNIFQRLVEPHLTIKSATERRFASSLATLLLALFPLYILPEGIRAVVQGHSLLTVAYYVIGALILGGAYVLARGRYPRWGGVVTLVYFMLIPFLALVIYGETYAGENAKNALIWSVPIMLMALILLQPRYVKWVIIFQIGLYLVIPGVWNGLSYPQTFSVLPLIIATGGLMMISALVQGRYLSQVEYQVNRSQESEARFRDLFVSSPVALLEADFSAIKTRLDDFAAQYGDGLREYILANPESMLGAGSSVRLLDANLQAQELYEADQLQDLLDGLLIAVDEQGMIALRDGVIALWEGKANEPIETIHQTLKNQKRDVVVRFSIRAGYEDSWAYVNIAVNNVTEKREAERRAARLLQEQIAVRKALETITSSLDINQVLHQIAQEVGEAVEATSTYIWHWDFETHVGVVASEYFGPDANEKESMSSLGRKFLDTDIDFIASLEANQHSIAHVGESKITEEYEDHLKSKGIKTALYIPIQLQGITVAFVEIWESRLQRDFSPDEIILCQHIAGNAAIAINNASNYEQAQEEIARRREVERELRKLSNAAQQAASGIVITDRDSIIEYANPAASLITGYPVEELIGQTPRILKSGMHEKAFYEELWKTVERGDTWRGELINKKKDGSLYWESQAISPVKNNQGEVTHYVAIKEDVTFARETRDRLATLSNAVEQAASGVVITDPDGYIEFVNPAFTAISGYSFQEVRGKKIGHILKSGEHEPEFYANLNETVQGGEIWKGEMVNRRKDGSLYWESTVISPVFDEGGKFVHIVEVKEDITARKELEGALRLAHEEALVASDMKTQLLANVSHDMRTPLGAILGYTEMLQAGVFEPLNEAQDNALRSVSASAQRLLDFVNNLLSQAQIDTGKIVLNVASFKPEKLITTMGGELSFARSKGLTVETEISEDLPELLKGDAYWLGQILHNLVSNAIKFTPSNGVIRIKMFDHTEERWGLSVSDTGKGIPPEAQEYIFDTFRQVDGSTQREIHTGSGLGLSIVQHLVRLMGGDIQLESELGQGSTFTVILPLNPVKES